jgi:transcription antitermination factor NusG
MFDEQPVPLPDEVIELIRQKVQHLETAGDLIPHGFQQGDIVRIKKGPLQDMLAIFDSPTTPAQRVQVLLDIFGHVRRVKIEVIDLEKAPPDVETPVIKRPRRTRGQGRRI